MKKPHIILAFLILALLVLAWSRIGSSQEKYPHTFSDESAARQYLKAQVAEGNMSEVEARVRLAELLVQFKKKDRKNEYIRKVMEKQGLNEDEAKEFLIKQKQSKGKKSNFPKNKGDKKAPNTAKEIKGK